MGESSTCKGREDADHFITSLRASRWRTRFNSERHGWFLSEGRNPPTSQKFRRVSFCGLSAKVVCREACKVMNLPHSDTAVNILIAHIRLPSRRSSSVCPLSLLLHTISAKDLPPGARHMALANRAIGPLELR